MEWSGIDIAIIIIIGLSVITGLIRGFLRELIALLAWVLAIFLSLNYCVYIAHWLTPYIEDNSVRLGIGFVVIIIGILLLGAMVNALLSFVLKHAGLSSVDRILGMGFGFLRGVLIVSLFMVIVGMTSLNLGVYQKKSRLYAYFKPVTTWISHYIEPLLLNAVARGRALKQQGSPLKPKLFDLEKKRESNIPRHPNPSQELEQ